MSQEHTGVRRPNVRIPCRRILPRFGLGALLILTLLAATLPCATQADESADWTEDLRERIEEADAKVRALMEELNRSVEDGLEEWRERWNETAPGLRKAAPADTQTRTLRLSFRLEGPVDAGPVEVLCEEGRFHISAEEVSEERDRGGEEAAALGVSRSYHIAIMGEAAPVQNASGTQARVSFKGTVVYTLAKRAAKPVIERQGELEFEGSVIAAIGQPVVIARQGDAAVTLSVALEIFPPDVF